MKTIIVTGAAGYIGSHTLIELLTPGNYQVVALDSYTSTSSSNYAAVEAVTSHTIRKHAVDITNYQALENIAKQYPGIDAIIHFAAFWRVSESKQKSLEYHRNSIGELNNLLKLAEKFHIPNFIFSSSCAVYNHGRENNPAAKTGSAYPCISSVGEQMLSDFAAVHQWFSYYALRYFNPAGYHPTGLIGENPEIEPQNLVSVICAAAARQKTFTVFGNDYPTPDGTCIRDYVHVCDIARAHALALQRMFEHNKHRIIETINLGTGKGYSVKEIIAAFERNNLVRVPYIIGPRKDGDIVSLYTSNEKAVKQLGWSIRYSIDEIMKTAWDGYQKTSYVNKNNSRRPRAYRLTNVKLDHFNANK